MEQPKKNQIEIMPVENEHAILAGQLPLHHKDPFDRMLIAQARIESLETSYKYETAGHYAVIMAERSRRIFLT